MIKGNSYKFTMGGCRNHAKEARSATAGKEQSSIPHGTLISALLPERLVSCRESRLLYQHGSKGAHRQCASGYSHTVPLLTRDPIGRNTEVLAL